MQEVIRVEQLSKSYHGKPVLENLSFSLQQGQYLGLLGANGAGKSTSIECILGTKDKDWGEVNILGMDPMRDRKRLFQKVGVQFQDSNYQREIKVDELCEVTSSFYKDSLDWKELLGKFGIIDKEKSNVKDLSGGERQRLFIALTLIPKPEILFMDELTTGLDARARREVWKILKNLKSEGMTMVLTSHFMDEVEALCDSIIILKKGNVIYQGTVEQAVKNSPYDKFENAYLWYTDNEMEVLNDENIL